MTEYPHVPGFTVNINDGSLYAGLNATGVHEPVLIIGPAAAGPLNTPTFVSNEQMLVPFATAPNAIYGTAAAPNILAVAWKEAFTSGCDNIRLMRIDGTTPHDLAISLIKALDLLNEVESAIHVAVVGLYSNDVIKVTATDIAETGGLYGVAKDDEGTLYAADDEIDLLFHFNKFILSQNSNGIETLGYIGAKPLNLSDPTLNQIRTFMDALPDIGEDYSGFLSVIGGIDLLCNCGTFDYISNGVAAYAGLVSTLAAHRPTTNKIVPGARLVYRPTSSMLEALGDKKYVTFRAKGNNVVVTLDITAAPDTSDFILLNTARIILAAIKTTRDVCDPFIGEGADPVSMNALQTALDKAYKDMISGGALLNARFNIQISPTDYLLGHSIINLEIVPIIERRKIHINVTASAQ